VIVIRFIEVEISTYIIIEGVKGPTYQIYLYFVFVNITRPCPRVLDWVNLLSEESIMTDVIWRCGSACSEVRRGLILFGKEFV